MYSPPCVHHRSTGAAHYPVLANRTRQSRKTRRSRDTGESADEPGPGPLFRRPAIQTSLCAPLRILARPRTPPHTPLSYDPILGQGIGYEHATSVPPAACQSSKAAKQYGAYCRSCSWRTKKKRMPSKGIRLVVAGWVRSSTRHQWRRYACPRRWRWYPDRSTRTGSLPPPVSGCH